MNKPTSILKLIICIGICESAGIVGSLFTIPAIPTWYESLVQPSFRPPNWVFSPVWITLYLLMGLSAFLLWNKTETLKKELNAISAFGLQLILNVFWSVAFFGFRSPLVGMLVILLLVASILWMIAAFYRISRPAAYLQIPYLLWVGFASVLNASILVLNTP